MFPGAVSPALRILLASTLIATTAPLDIAAGPASQPPDNADTRTEGTGQTLASTTTSITQSGSPGDYTLTATVVGAGTLSAAPSGTVSFLDISNGDAVVATATLGGETSGALAWTNTQTLEKEISALA